MLIVDQTMIKNDQKQTRRGEKRRYDGPSRQISAASAAARGDLSAVRPLAEDIYKMYALLHRSELNISKLG